MEKTISTSSFHILLMDKGIADFDDFFDSSIFWPGWQSWPPAGLQYCIDVE
jgi:hypothetical protein